MRRILARNRKAGVNGSIAARDSSADNLRRALVPSANLVGWSGRAENLLKIA